MRETGKIDKLINNKLKTSASPELDRRIDSLVANAETRQIQTSNIWRITMRNRMTKIALAALILIATVLSITFFNKTVTPAYALGQTIEALSTMRSIHAKIYYPVNSEPALLWVEFYENGQAKRLRTSQPGFDPHDGPKEVVWDNNTAQVWSKKTNTLYFIRDIEAAQKISRLFQNLDPKLLIKQLEAMEEEGTAQLTIEQPDDISEPIIVTATLIEEDQYLGHRAIALVDQATKLVISLETFKGDGTLSDKNGHFGPEDFNRVEFFDYNQSFEEEVFVLNVPADAMVIDRVTNKVGLSRGNMRTEDTAVEVVKYFLQSIIDEDYETAGLMYGGVSAEKIQEGLGKQLEGEILKVLSVGAAKIHSNPDYKNKAYVVPCTIEFTKNGQVKQKTFRCVVREVDGQRGQWAICGGI